MSIIGVQEDDDTVLSRRVVDELRGWFGAHVNEWELLRVYRIPRALPRQAEKQSKRYRGLIVCGDHVEDPSINGALLSGRKAAEAVSQKINSS